MIPTDDLIIVVAGIVLSISCTLIAWHYTGFLHDLKECFKHA